MSTKLVDIQCNLSVLFLGHEQIYGHVQTI